MRVISKRLKWYRISIGFVVLAFLVVLMPTLSAAQNSNRGATVPWIEYEAEDGNTNGTILGPDRTWTTIPSEASGRRAVLLDATGEYVQFTASSAANSVVVRYVIPDALSGGGINATISLYVNNVFRKKLKLTSRYAWVYGGWDNNNSTQRWSNNPSDGSPHKFFDEARALVGKIPAGATVKLQKDAKDKAAYYVIDLIDLERVAPRLSMPANFLSITDFGAVANDGGDDGPQIQDCINTAMSQGGGVWIPAGRFNNTTTPLEVKNMIIRGAGMWYSTLILEGGNSMFNCKGGDLQFYDFSVLGYTTNRDDTRPEDAFNGPAGPGSRLEGIWIEHTKAGYWVGGGSDGLVITRSRIRNTFADGVNFFSGTSNSVVEQTHLRNTGDDALASWSPTSGGVNTNNVFRFNTVQMVWFAQGLAIYGGRDNKIEDNVVFDTVTMPGIILAQAFTSHAFTGMTSVQRNTLIRAGGFFWNQEQGALKLASEQGFMHSFDITDLLIHDPTYSGFWISPGQGLHTLYVQNVQIDNAGTFGLVAQAGGAGDFTNVVVTNPRYGGLNNLSGFNFIRHDGNSGW